MVAQQEQFRYDALVVLGHNFSINNGEPKLSLPARMTAKAAGILFEQNIAPRVIFSGGFTAGEKYKSEAQGMLDYANRRGQVINPDRVDLEQRSFDTLSNSTEVAELLRKRGIQKVALLTRKEHLKRSTKDFASQGIKVNGYACEDVLADRFANHRARYTYHLEKLFFPGHHLITRLKENMLILYQKIDKKVRLQRFITRKSRHATI